MSRRFLEFYEDDTSDFMLLGPPLSLYKTSFPLPNLRSGPKLTKFLFWSLRALLTVRFKNEQSEPKKQITKYDLNAAESIPVATGKSGTAPKSAPRGRVFVEHVARAQRMMR